MIKKKIALMLSTILLAVSLETVNVLAEPSSAMQEQPSSVVQQEPSSKEEASTENQTEQVTEKETEKETQKETQIQTEAQAIGSLDVSADYGYAGKEVKVTITVTGSNLSGCMTKVRYDESKLTYLHCTGAITLDGKDFAIAKGNESLMQLVVSFKVNEEAKLNDIYAINVTTQLNNGGELTGSDSVVVKSDAQEETESETESKEESTKRPNDIVGNGPTSSDTTLTSIKVEGYNLTPAFDSSVTNYTLTVPGDVTSLNVTATVLDSRSDYRVTGAKKLEVGTNSIKVICTAEDGTAKSYTITVTRQEPESETETEAQEQTVAVVQNNTSSGTQKTSGVPMWVVFLLCVVFMVIGFAICYILFVGFDDYGYVPKKKNKQPEKRRYIEEDDEDEEDDDDDFNFLN